MSEENLPEVGMSYVKPTLAELEARLAVNPAAQRIVERAMAIHRPGHPDPVGLREAIIREMENISDI